VIRNCCCCCCCCCCSSACHEGRFDELEYSATCS